MNNIEEAISITEQIFEDNPKLNMWNGDDLTDDFVVLCLAEMSSEDKIKNRLKEMILQNNQ